MTTMRTIIYDPKIRYGINEFERIRTSTTDAINNFNLWIKQKSAEQNYSYLASSKIAEAPLTNFPSQPSRKSEAVPYYHRHGERLLAALIAFGEIAYPSATEPKTSYPLTNIYGNMAKVVWDESFLLTIKLFNDEHHSEDYALLLIENLEAAQKLLLNPTDFTAMLRAINAMQKIQTEITGNSYLAKFRSSAYGSAEGLHKVLENLATLFFSLAGMTLFILFSAMTTPLTLATITLLSYVAEYSFAICIVSAASGLVFHALGAMSKELTNWLAVNPELTPHVNKINSNLETIIKKINPDAYKEANKRWYENLGKYVPSFFYACAKTDKKEVTPTPQPN